MPSSRLSTHKADVLRIILLIFGVFCSSTAIIMIKASNEQPFLVSSYRLLIAAIVLSPLFFRDLRASHVSFGWKQLGWSAIPALILAGHFMSWVIGGRMTQVASASLIINLMPIAMPFFLWMLYRERVTRTEVVGTGFSLAGLLVLSSATLSISRTNLLGDLICFGSMLTYTGYLAFGRQFKDRISLWLYLVPLYFMAGLICLLCALPWVNPIKPYTLTNVLCIVGLGLVPTVFGHTIMNYSMQHFRGQVVSVINLGQPIFAGLLAFLIFNERPLPIYYLAAVLILAGAVIVIFSSYAADRQTAQTGRAAQDAPPDAVSKPAG
jgi:drug/metabolite transporter (DMT)-like permease